MTRPGINQAEFRDPKVQRKIVLALLKENRPMAARQLGERLSLHPSIVAGNLGELQAKEHVRRVEGESAITRYEITPAGIMQAHQPEDHEA